MTSEEFRECLEAINRTTMNAIVPGGAWAVVLLALSEVAAAGVAIWLFMVLTA